MSIRLFVLCATPLFAQFGRTAIIRGELQFESSASDDYQVEVTGCTGGGAVTRGWLSNSNLFEFDDLQPGCKVVRVVAGPQRTPVKETQIYADTIGIPVTIRISAEKRDQPGGLISAERLRHPFPEKAVRALADASQLYKAERYTEAAKKLRPITDHYPEFWELHLGLGVIEMKLGNLEIAADHFLKVRELNPKSFLGALDAGFALAKLNRLPEAEQAANAAIAIDPQNEIAHLLLARIRSTHPAPTDN